MLLHSIRPTRYIRCTVILIQANVGRLPTVRQTQLDCDNGDILNSLRKFCDIHDVEPSKHPCGSKRQ